MRPGFGTPSMVNEALFFPLRGRPLVCPDCGGGAMRIIAFIEEARVVRAILEHLSLWDEPRPSPVMPGSAPRAPAELECLPWVE